MYQGNGPYCYANCLAMMIGTSAPSAGVIEFATCSPFGMQIIEGLPFFDPLDWDPLLALDDTLKAMGWSSVEIIGNDSDDAMSQLKSKLADGPVFVGPVDLGYLSYQPGPRGADHYVVVLQIDDMVHLHDPNGHPHATLPIKDFVAAWGSRLPYGQPFTMRADFQKLEDVSEEDIIRRTLSTAKSWVKGEESAQSALAAGAMMKNLHPGLRGHLTEFAIRVGTRRLADASACMSRVGYDEVAKMFDHQARLVGSLQYLIQTKDSGKAADVFRNLSLTYKPLEAALMSIK